MLEKHTPRFERKGGCQCISPCPGKGIGLGLNYEKS